MDMQGFNFVKKDIAMQLLASLSRSLTNVLIQLISPLASSLTDLIIMIVTTSSDHVNKL